MSEVDKELAELFEYHFGVDLTQSKYDEGRRELAEYFTRKTQKWVNDFYRHHIDTIKMAPMPKSKPSEKNKNGLG